MRGFEPHSVQFTCFFYYNKYMVIAFCSHGLMVMTADFESASLGSIPSGSFLKRGGAEEACLAHNQKDGGSKPLPAIRL